MEYVSSKTRYELEIEEKIAVPLNFELVSKRKGFLRY